MAISRVTGQDCRGQTTATGHAIYPGATTPGNLLLASAYSSVGANLTLAGWTPIQQQFSGASLSLFGKIADGTENTLDVGSGSGVTKVHGYEYSGFTGTLTELVDASAISTSFSTNTTATTPSVSTSKATDLVFATCMVNGATTGHTVNSPFTLLQVDASAIRLMDADYLPGALGTYAATFNWTTTQTGRTVIAAFREAPDGQLFFFSA